MKRGVAVALLTLALWVPAAAQSLDAASNEALAATLRLLLDPAGRSAAISGNTQASAIDRQLQGIVGASNMQDIYALAAAVFNDLALTAVSGALREYLLDKFLSLRTFDLVVDFRPEVEYRVIPSLTRREILARSQIAHGAQASRVFQIGVARSPLGIGAE